MALARWFGVIWNPTQFLHLCTFLLEDQEGQEVGCTLHPSTLTGVALLCASSQIQQKRGGNSPELRKCVHPRLPDLPSQQPISLPSPRLRFTGTRCCRIHPSIWNPLPVWPGFPEHPGAYSQSLLLWRLWPHPTGFNGFNWPHSSHLDQDEILTVLADLAHIWELVYCTTGYFMLKQIMRPWRSFIRAH